MSRRPAPRRTSFPGGGPAAARRELARRPRALGGGGQGHVPPGGARGGGGAALRGGEGPGRAPWLPKSAPGRDPRRGTGLVRRSGVSPRPRRAPARRSGPRPRLGLGYRRLLRGGAGGRVRPRRRGGHHRRTDRQGHAASRSRGVLQVEFVEAHIEELPFDNSSFDAVLSNGVINLSPAKHRVFAEAARVLRPGGRLAIADIVSGRALKERTRRNVELWAACIAGAIPRATTWPRSRRTAYTSTSYEQKTTASRPSGRSTPAAPTRSRASRWSPPSRAQPTTETEGGAR